MNKLDENSQKGENFYPIIIPDASGESDFKFSMFFFTVLIILV
jgi:hypothetical protein